MIPTLARAQTLSVIFSLILAYLPLGTVVIAGHTRETIQVLVPDCTVPPVGNDIRIDLQHVVELKMGPAFNMGLELSPPDLALSLCPSSLESTLGLQRRAYWEEINPPADRITIYLIDAHNN